MLRIITFFSLLTVASTAAADGLTRDDDWMIELSILPTSEGLTYRAGANLSARADDESSTAAFGVDAALAWQLSACRALHVGGDFELTTERSSGSASFGFCIPTIVNVAEFTFTFDRDLRPSLSGKAIGLRSRYSGFTLGIDNTMIAVQTSAAQHRVGTVEVEMGLQSQASRNIASWDLNFSAYQLASTKTDFVLDILTVGIHSKRERPTNAESNALTSTSIQLAPVRLTAVELASAFGGVVRTDIEVGGVMGNIAEPPTAGMDVGAQHIGVSGMFVDVALELVRPRDKTRVRALRGLEPTYDEEILRDDRVEIEIQRDLGPHVVSLGGFAAYSSLIGAEGHASAASPTGGARAGFVANLSQDLRLALSAERAYSFYGTLNDQRDLKPEWATQVMAKLSFAKFR